MHKYALIMQKHGQEKAMLFLGSVPRSVERAVSCPTLPSGSVVTIGKEENCTYAITAPQMCNITYATGLTKPSHTPADTVEAVHVTAHTIRQCTALFQLSTHTAWQLVVAREVVASQYPSCRHPQCGTMGLLTPMAIAVID